MEKIITISEFILKSFLHIWPYLLITIPLAVIVNLSGASKYINKALGKKPLLSVFLATAIGAFSPFCSCGVIPVISSLLIGGVPVAPVMSFWIASPSMDPEIFFLSSSVLGWKLAIWRLVSTFIISLSAGYITHFMMIRGFLGTEILKTSRSNKGFAGIKSLTNFIKTVFPKRKRELQIITPGTGNSIKVCCEIDNSKILNDSDQTGENACSCKNKDDVEEASFRKRVFTETLKATYMVTKFMGIAFLITALITIYLPEDVISWIVNGNPVIQVVLATLIGIPLYTSNITALPFAGGLIEMGLNSGAALAFLIAGATTTLPAMVAVWGITKRKIFLLYLSFALFGALAAGFTFNLFN